MPVYGENDKIERKFRLLKAIINEYNKKAEPVGSELVVVKYKIDASPATVRNEMAELEEEGYIWQPHTSAGRVPTEKAYRFYLANWFTPKELGDKEKKALERLAAVKAEQREVLKYLAKGLAELSVNTVFVAFSENDFYYTGVSNLFQQPECQDLERVRDWSEIIDQMDEIMPAIYRQAAGKINILIGQENPFSEFCAVMFSRLPNQQVCGILAPLRMDYEKNWARLKYLQDLRSKI